MTDKDQKHSTDPSSRSQIAKDKYWAMQENIYKSLRSASLAGATAVAGMSAMDNYSKLKRLENLRNEYYINRFTDTTRLNGHLGALTESAKRNRDVVRFLNDELREAKKLKNLALPHDMLAIGALGLTGATAAFNHYKVRQAQANRPNIAPAEKTAAAYKPVHEINHPQSPITPQPVDVRMITFEDEHPVDYTTFGTDMDSRMYADELAYYNKVDRKHPKTWRTRLDTLGRTLSIPAGTLGALYAYSKIPDRVPFLRRNPNLSNVLAVASGVGGFIGGLHLYDKFQNPRSRTLAAIDADIADQQEEITNNAFADSDFMDDYTKEHLRSVRTPLGRRARMNALFDKYNLPTKYQHNVRV